MTVESRPRLRSVGDGAERSGLWKARLRLVRSDFAAERNGIVMVMMMMMGMMGKERKREREVYPVAVSSASALSTVCMERWSGDEHRNEAVSKS